jgi:protein SCO1/2
MNRNLLEARDLLTAATTGPTNWSLLSISFDPAIDRPAVLAAHARTYRGTNTAGWLFAVADTNTLARLRPAFDLKIARVEGGFSHNLRTVVVDPLGKVARQFDGNRWTPAELAEAITTAARTADRP